MEITKRNGNVCFSEETHTYWNENDNGRYISVTTLIGQYEPQYDSQFWSWYKALEKLLPKDIWKIESAKLRATKRVDNTILSLYNIDENILNGVQQDILDEWERNKIESCERGTKIHALLENNFYKAGTNVSLKKFGIGGRFECKKDYLELDLPYGVYPEYLIYYESPDKQLRVAGQIDLLIKDGNQITLVDHKGLALDTPIYTDSGFKTMGSIEVGDTVYDKDSNLCKVIIKSNIHYNPCYLITFDTGETIVADHEHRWLISSGDVLTTEELQVGNTIDKIKSEGYRTIVKIEPHKTVPTQCISVDSPSHTYCCGIGMIPTHNTNKEITRSGYRDNITKQTEKMLYPLNNLDHCKLSEYTMQLSTYAWMLQKIRPEFIIKALMLNHYDHQFHNELIPCEYKKREVELMLAHYKKNLILQQQRAKRKPIEY